MEWSSCRTSTFGIVTAEFDQSTPVIGDNDYPGDNRLDRDQTSCDGEKEDKLELISNREVHVTA